ncbi:MAG: tRNA preQ1(34) S-adenosylmethionine ribosyltransferase-isomerase QueA [Cyanobacteria bacterium]|nr:tRNA preQ1(34) S-adenosylmethionine ribosyltransferase-isomerase QueA [Cyanobacteria bacterium CG_2015-16_32_12]NCO78393.1 tRNA preQ1(34) S-adenosylmethionine ribosyltransferase-isomerase QueA [Cyanobacteria bacterium CG_2015-22_32_23]NCQ02962.1 tRNA preQ1(34) S-adenosylmethionine ribosyltransferase-isomerase QueA [Cyanobacteria bacterium CG_2015-09_32_10]NCQ41619.1 tRNA preQ1(34) S-adenosylmethionine ribosyltransferase-isomerase QueA [Cyanobacteria bacterium CG_2015-04_32_10]NCS85036.1 tRNA
MNLDQQLSSYDYYLPSELIAQNPVIPRDTSRLLVVKSQETINHHVFSDLPDLLSSGDLLVLNDTLVIPARLYGKKSTGAQVEVLLVEETENNCWLALVKPGKRFSIGSEIIFGDILKATVIGKDESTGGRFLQFEVNPCQSFWEILDKVGNIPFPPYVTESQANPQQYQTVYAEKQGAIAAPTAGLHFTERLLTQLTEKQINIAKVTLHVGIGTFRPVEVEDILNHEMHQEWIEVNQNTIDAIKQTKEKGKKVIAVGTTVVRTLEGAYQQQQKLIPFSGKTNLFIYPSYEFKVIDGLITNFHLPKSSLLMLVSALIGRERLMSIYQKAMEEKYRFYSFGDGMFIQI